MNKDECTNDAGERSDVLKKIPSLSIYVFLPTFRIFAEGQVFRNVKSHHAGFLNLWQTFFLK